MVGAINKIEEKILWFVGIAIRETVNALRNTKDAKNDCFKKTEEQLYAYMSLKDNVEKYQQNIEDIKAEGVGRSSKDIVFYSTGGSRLTDDEIIAGRILAEQRKIYRDQRAIDEISDGLKSIESDTYSAIIKYKYFQRKSDDEIGELVGCDARTVRRNKNRLVKNIAIKLYGADAL